MTAFSRNLPVSSTTAILQPVRMPGSRASTRQHAGGRREQQVLQILAEDLDGFFVGAVLQFQPHFGLDGGIQQALVGIFDGLFQMRRPVAALAQDLRS